MNPTRVPFVWPGRLAQPVHYDQDFFGSAAPTGDQLKVKQPLDFAQVALGPRSDVDQILVTPREGDPFVVGVGAPSFITNFKGPCTLTTYPSPVNQLPTIDTGGVGEPARLELYLYGEPPDAVPVQRPSKTRSMTISAPGSQPNAGHFLFAVPMFGRRKYLVSVSTATAGGLNWQLFGRYLNGDYFPLNAIRPVAQNVVDAQEESVGGETMCWLGAQIWGQSGAATVSLSYEVRD